MEVPPALPRTRPRRRSACALAGLLLLVPLVLAPPASAQPCPAGPGGTTARVAMAGATSSARDEDAAFMTLPVVPGQPSLVYIRLVGVVEEPGDVSFSYAFHLLDAVLIGTRNAFECEPELVGTASFTYEDVPGPSTISLERPILTARQNLDVVFHIRTSGIEAAAWEIEVHPCGNGGWLC